MMMENSLEQDVDCVQELSAVQVQKRAADYLRQSNMLILLNHMSALMLEVQNHRGASMAVLSGSEEFVSSMELAKQRVTAYLNLIEQFNTQTGNLITPENWTAIQTEWQALNQEWRSDEVLTNFEFHSHLIDCLIKKMSTLSDKLNSLSGSESQRDQLPESRTRQLLLHICLKVMPELIESIAKLRGLSTHLCVTGKPDEGIVSRLNSLQQELNFNKEGLRKACKALPHSSYSELPALAAILLHEHKLGQLQQLVQNKVLETSKVEFDGERLFAMATDIIEAYYQIVVDGLACFQQNVRRQWLG